MASLRQLVPTTQNTRFRPATSNVRLSTIASGRPASNDDLTSRARRANDDDFTNRARRANAPLTLYSQTPPWQSRAVLQLANAAARGGNRAPNATDSTGITSGSCEKIEPMLVEGPRGTSLRALGSQEDHKVAGDALSREIAKQRESRAQGEVPQWDVLRANRPKNRAAEFEDLPSTSVGKSSKARGLVFGAVYEHLDSSGRPRIIASTSALPEQQFLQDGQNHRPVADLLTRGRGSSRVVWAGVGEKGLGVGDKEMTAIRQAIVDHRSKRLDIQKLSGFKPYSSHGY